MGCLINAQGPENSICCVKRKIELDEASFWRLGGGDVDIEVGRAMFGWQKSELDW
jgi:hypothetical protein